MSKKNNKIAKKKKLSIEEKGLKEKIDDFRYSDSIPAVATKILLAGIFGIGGIALGGAIIPGVIRAIKEMEEGSSYAKNIDNYSNKKIKNAFHSLKRRKFVKVIKYKNGKVKIKITAKGKKRIQEVVFDNLKINKPATWDKKWRILIFDIPIDLNNARNALRRKVKNLGFYQFQGSVWFYPYPCEDEILAIAEFFKVSGYIEIITAESVLHEKELKKHFKLK